MTSTLQLPEPGQLVGIRQRRYIGCSMHPPSMFASLKRERRHHLITLSSVEDDALGEELQVIWEIEPGATTIEKIPLHEPIGFDTPQRLDTFLLTCFLMLGSLIYARASQSALSNRIVLAGVLCLSIISPLYHIGRDI